jgi:hypothetical protein
MTKNMPINKNIARPRNTNKSNQRTRRLVKKHIKQQDYNIISGHYQNFFSKVI